MSPMTHVLSTFKMEIRHKKTVTSANTSLFVYLDFTMYSRSILCYSSLHLMGYNMKCYKKLTCLLPSRCQVECRGESVYTRSSRNRASCQVAIVHCKCVPVSSILPVSRSPAALTTLTQPCNHNFKKVTDKEKHQPQRGVNMTQEVLLPLSCQ